MHPLKTLALLIPLVLLASCLSPISGVTNYTPGPQTSGLPFGNGLTTYVGFQDSGDGYHTGLMVYPNGGSTWKQLLSSVTTVKDVFVAGSSSIAVALPNAVMYYNGSSWGTASFPGVQVNGVSIATVGVLRVYAATSTGVSFLPASSLSPSTGLTLTDNGNDHNAVSIFYLPFNSTFFVGMASGLVETDGSSSNNLVGSGALNSAYVSNVQGSSSALFAANAIGLSRSLDHGATWTDIPSATIGLGSVLSVYDTGGEVYVGCAQGVAMASDTANLALSASWSTGNLGLSVNSISAATAGGDTCLYAATPQGLYIYSFGQKAWSVAFQGFTINKVFITVP